MTIASSNKVGTVVLFWCLGLAACRSSGTPLVVCSADFDKVLDELAKLVVVDTDQFCVVRGAEVEERNEAEDLGDQCGDGEDVGSAGDNVCELDIKLLVVVVEPATNKRRIDTVEGDDLVFGEETVEQETDHTRQRVLCEQIECVIDADQVLDWKNNQLGFKEPRQDVLFVP